MRSKHLTIYTFISEKVIVKQSIWL